MVQINPLGLDFCVPTEGYFSIFGLRVSLTPRLNVPYSVGPVCCVMHVKEPGTLIVKEKGLAPVFLDLRLEHPAGWICGYLQIFCIIIISSKRLVVFGDHYSACI